MTVIDITSLAADTGADRARIAVLRAQVDRLRRRLARRPPTPLVDALGTSLGQLDDSLAAALVGLDTRTEAAYQYQRAGTVPERVLAALVEPRGPETSPACSTSTPPRTPEGCAP